MIRLTIIVNNVNTYMSMGFTHLNVYVSDSEDGSYTALTSIVLVAGKAEYLYTHTTGTSDNWYKSSIYSSTSTVECCWSDAVRGDCPSLYHNATYPAECEFDEDENVVIRKIRRLIGDLENLKHLYVDCTDEFLSCSFIENDNRTINLEERGWPVYIAVNDEEKTSLDDPIVQGYQYLTFSGTLNSGVVNDIIDVWYYAFKFSDREIYDAYSDSMIPPGLTSSTVTQDHLILQASIDLLENMTSADMIEDGARIVDGNTSYDPSPGLAERDKTIKRLKAMLDSLVKQYMMSDLTGILID
jgi:hypothetical protein